MKRLVSRDKSLETTTHYCIEHTYVRYNDGEQHERVVAKRVSGSVRRPGDQHKQKDQVKYHTRSTKMLMLSLTLYTYTHTYKYKLIYIYIGMSTRALLVKYQRTERERVLCKTRDPRAKSQELRAFGVLSLY